MSELELKFLIPAPALSSLRLALRARGAERTRLRARYFDTAHGLLARHRVALRLRLEGRHWVQTLKAPGAGAVHRLEHEVQVAGHARTLPLPDLRLHAGSAAGLALQAALQSEPGAVLVERYATDITRQHCVLDMADGSQVEVALDIGRAMAGSQWVAITELELEHKGGPVQGLFNLADAWVRHGGLWQSTITKAERGERLMAAAAAAAATEPAAASAPATAPASTPTPTRARKAPPAPPRLDASADGATVLRSLLQDTLAPVLAAASEVAEGDVAASTIHRLRVALRRLRTVLRELRALSTHIKPEWETALAHTFGQLGLTRDQQAVAAAVRPLLVAAGAPRLQWQAAPAPDPAVAVRELEFQTTLLAILALAHAAPASFEPLAPPQLRALLATRLQQLHRQVTHAGRRFEGLPLEHQHRARKRLKRLRYLADLTLALWPERAARRYLKRLGAAQAALGLHNDVAVAANAFHQDAAAHPQAWIAAGWLLAHLAVTARSARKALQAVAEAETFWG